MPKIIYNGVEYVGSIENNIETLYYSNSEPENLSKGMTWISDETNTEIKNGTIDESETDANINN